MFHSFREGAIVLSPLCILTLDVLSLPNETPNKPTRSASVAAVLIGRTIGVVTDDFHRSSVLHTGADRVHFLLGMTLHHNFKYRIAHAVSNLLVQIETDPLKQQIAQ